MPETKIGEKVKQLDLQVVRCDFWNDLNRNKASKGPDKKRKFECEICFKNFTRRENLVGHIRRHSGEKPYICNIC